MRRALLPMATVALVLAVASTALADSPRPHVVVYKNRAVSDVPR